MPAVGSAPTVELNEATGKLEMVFTGDGFVTRNGASVPEDIDVFVDGVKQEVLSVSDGEIRVALDNTLGGGGSAPVELYFPKGIPDGRSNYEGGVEISPALLGLSHRIAGNGLLGSVGGSEIEAVVPGIGVEDAGRYTLVGPDGTDICASVKIEEYGKLKCNVTAGLEFDGGDLALKLVGSSTEIACATEAADAQACSYRTAAVGDEPSISGIALSADGTEMTFTGANFPASTVGSNDYTCEGSYGGAVATGCVINNAGEAVLQFDDGAPTVETPGVAPVLRFIPTDGTIVDTASGSSLVENPLAITAVNGGSDLSSSFAGGQILNIQANGLAEKVALGEAVVRVCS